MDAVVYALKRAFHSSLRAGRAVLGEVGVTPARFDVLFALTDGRVVKTQRGLRQALGVCRATMSETLGELERRGWIARERDVDDRRTHRVSLTPAGRALFERAYDAAVGDGVVPRAVEAALAETCFGSFEAQESLEYLCRAVRRFFGDTAVRELYPWHPDEYLGALHHVSPGSSELVPVED
jgi:DNA-binding MarR family transcriptional regulator